jgi:hypothetical protein
MGLFSLRALGTLKSHFKDFKAIFKQMDLFLMQRPISEFWQAYIIGLEAYINVLVPDGVCLSLSNFRNLFIYFQL